MKHVVTIVRDDGEVDYLYEETVKYSPPPYKVKAVDHEAYRTAAPAKGHRFEGATNSLKARFYYNITD